MKTPIHLMTKLKMSCYMKSQNIIKQYGIFILLLIWLIVDIWIRRDSIFSFQNGFLFYWSPEYLGFYLLSAILSFQYLLIIRAILYWIKKKFPKTAYALLGIILVFWSFIYVGTWEYYSYFNAIPNFYTFQYMVLEPGEANSIIYSAINFGFIFKVMVLSSVSILIYVIHLNHYHPTGKKGKIIPLVAFLLAVLAWLVLNNNIRFMDQCLTPDANSFVTWLKVKTHKPSKSYFNRAGLHAGSRPLLNLQKDSPPFNVIFVINESLRSRNLQFYGYSKTTMPFFQKRLEARPEEYFIFKKSYANSTSTMVAFPCLIAGVNATDTGRKLHEQPLLWDYAASLNYYTAVISSQIYNWRNLLTFLRSPRLDDLWYQEISGHEILGSEYFGIDDQFTVERFLKSFKNALEKNKRFFGILHTFDTHYPYYSPDSLKPFEGPLSEYDNSIYYLDHNLEKVFKFLEEKNELDKTIIFFTSDHGEAFKEHGISGHITNLYIETIQIPIWIKIPKNLQKRFRVDILRSNVNRSISNADLLPTFLDIIDIPIKDELFSVRKDVEGQSLFRNIPKDRKIVVTNNTEYSVIRADYFTSIIDDNFKFNIRLNANNPFFEYYDLAQDSLCQYNIWDSVSSQTKSDLYHFLEKYENTRQVLKYTRWVNEH